MLSKVTRVAVPLASLVFASFVTAQTVYVGPDQLPIQEAVFGYSNTYKVLRVGLDQPARSVALNVDPATVAGGNFTGRGQILVGNNSVLAPNATGGDWMGVLRATEGKVMIGGGMSGGELDGSGLVVAGNYVGVGTAAPQNPLEVRGISRFGNGTDYGWIFAGISGGLNAFHVGSVTDVPLAFFTHGSAPKVVIDTAGNVGIGSNNPPYSLYSVGDIGVASGKAIFARYGADETHKASLGWSHLQLGNNGPNWIVAGRTVNGGSLTFVVDNTNDYTYAGFNGKEAMHIAAGGNVGIGTTSPTHKLAVNGTIRAKEVIVDTGWADHVFAADYRLVPLSEVEQHIQQNGHLPDVPSAADVAARGVSIGEMQKILLQKIEELTLHQIEQEKRLNSQAERIRALETENAQLRQH